MFNKSVCAAAMLLASQFAAATVVTFDDIPGTKNLGIYGIPDGYAGLNWDKWIIVPEISPYTAVSGRYVAATADARNEAKVSSPTAFTFQGAYISGIALTTVHVELFYHGQMVGRSVDVTPNATHYFLSSGYNGLVDSLTFVSTNKPYYSMDNFIYNEAPAPVPEPAIASMMLAGLGLLSWKRR